MSIPATVIYHSADFDGIFCREIARKFLPKDTVFHGWDFGDKPLPIPPEGTIYVMDLPVDRVFGGAFHASGTAGVYLGGKDFTDRLIWIDHHKSSIDTHPSWLDGYRIDGVAACRLAWQWFTCDEIKVLLPTKENFVTRNVYEPMPVMWAGEYDVWDKRDSEAERFQFGLRGEREVDFLSLLNPGPNHTPYINRLLNSGTTVQTYQRKVDAIAAGRSFVTQAYGLNFLVINSAFGNSLAFASKDKPETGHDALMLFYWDGRDYVVSMYHAAHNTGIDLSEIAKAHGGGGHRGACGFRTKTPSFLP